jgi:hypothetical protein
MCGGAADRGFAAAWTGIEIWKKILRAHLNIPCRSFEASGHIAGLPESCAVAFSHAMRRWWPIMKAL